jgi:flagellin-like hook-associated protein FlgL
MAIGNMVAFGDPARARSNIAAWNLINQVNGLNREIAIRQLRLATGKQQPRMEDGASFFAVWNKMRNQVRGKEMALDNVGDAKDELSLAEAGMLRVDELLGRMRDLVVRAGNDSLTDEQREDIRLELLNLYMAIGEVAKRTKFNEGGLNEDALLDGFSHTYQVGPNEDDKFNVEIKNILQGVTEALSPEISSKITDLKNALSSLSTDTRAALAKETKEFAALIPDGSARSAIEKLAWAFKTPSTFELEFVSTVASMSPEDQSALFEQVATLFNERLDAEAANPPGTDFIGDAELKNAFQNLTPLVTALVGESKALDTLSEELMRIADNADVEHPDLIKELDELAKVIHETNNAFFIAADNLESTINSVFTSPTQRLFLAQDLTFFGASDPRTANRPDVQNALNQLALDIANETPGLPNFKDALKALDNDGKRIMQDVIKIISSDSQNGLSFHLAQDLDGPNGTFTPQNPNGFAAFVTNIAERLPDPEDRNDIALAVVFQGVAGALQVQFPDITNRLNDVIGVLADNDDTNDGTLANAMLALGGEIESSTGTSRFFTNPVSRGSVRNAFLAQVGSPAFNALSPQLQQAYVDQANGLVGLLDLNGPGGPYSPDGLFGNLILNITETNPIVVTPDAVNDDTNMASMFQIVSGGLGEGFEDVAGLLNNASLLLTDENDGNDQLLALTMQALGAASEAATGGDEIDGTARAELRRAFLEATASQAFDNLSLAAKGAYLTMAESFGAFTAEQVGQFDGAMDPLSVAMVPDQAAIASELADVADVLTDDRIKGKERDAVISGLQRAAKTLNDDDPRVAALRDALDAPTNDDDKNPADMVGILGSHISDSQNQAMDTVFDSVNGSNLLSSLQDFVALKDTTDTMMLLAGVDNAIDFVKDQLNNLAGVQVKLTSFENILSTSAVAEASVASRFGDADLAKEQVELAKLQLFSQLATGQAAAANVAPSQLIGGLLGGR